MICRHRGHIQVVLAHVLTGDKETDDIAAGRLAWAVANACSSAPLSNLQTPSA